MALLDLLIVLVIVWVALSVRLAGPLAPRAGLPDRWEPHTRGLDEGGDLSSSGGCRGEPAQPVAADRG